MPAPLFRPELTGCYLPRPRLIGHRPEQIGRRRIEPGRPVGAARAAGIRYG